ncbi:F-box associated domain [Macleaya cordata]|uniref:F-box associated domain n=1 Tax=Macleaya cordata TaxID=56857 RepID=A0A200QU74_MACCD|nr:F-box associated domain [Macleaya cordata]
MENLDLAINSEIPSRVPADDESVAGLLFSIGFSKNGNWCSNVQLYYGEYDEINIDQQYYNNTLVSRINHPSFETLFDNDLIVGSCNGLVCLSIPRMNDPVYICNPFTSEYVYLPKTINEEGFLVSGFGYHRSTDEYKVVRIYYPDQHSMGRVEVYTLGSGNGWRDKGEIPYSLFASSGILANGALHWLDYKEWKIVAFDLADEEFRLLPSPPCFSCFFPSPLPCCFDLYGVGRLCVVHHERSERVDIWSLKQENSSWSWSREFSIAWECLDKDGEYEPFAITKNNEVLLWYNGTILSCYDPKTETFKKLMDDMGIQYFQAITHMNSSVSLKALEENSKKIIGQLHNYMCEVDMSWRF